MIAVASPAVASPTETAKTPGPSGQMTVEVRRDLEFAPEDAAVLETLIAARPHVGVFVSKAWLTGCFAEPPDGFEPSLLLMREGRRLRCVVPIAIRRTSTHARVALLGGGRSDRVDLLASRGYETASADALLSWLSDSFGSQGFVLELRDVPSDSPLWAAIHRAGIEGRQRLALVPREVFPVPYLNLIEPGTHVNGDPPSRVSSLVRHRRWLQQRGQLRIETLRDAGEILSAFDSLVRFLSVRWRGQGGSVLDDSRAERFHRRVLPLLLAEGRLKMIRLSADMRPVAVYYGLAVGPWSGYYLAGYDREWAGRIHLGQITLAAAMNVMAHDGAAEFDFLKGAERAKYLWPVCERITIDADVYADRFGPQASRSTRAAREAAVALAKTANGVRHHVESRLLKKSAT
jgi:CelD/BcsL family acetyltransferase involved in cellulose biosynthesis